MTYTLRPNPSGDTLVSSRDPIRTNFQVIRDDFATNHGEFNEGDSGKHLRVDLVEQTTFPATAASESWMASRTLLSGVTSRSELVWRPESELAAGDQFVLSAMPIRCACTFTINTAVGAQTLIGRSFNITSVTRTSITNYDVIMTNALPTSTYWMIGNAHNASGSDQGTVALKTAGPTTTTFSFRPSETANGITVSFLIMGG